MRRKRKKAFFTVASNIINTVVFKLHTALLLLSVSFKVFIAVYAAVENGHWLVGRPRLYLHVICLFELTLGTGGFRPVCILPCLLSYIDNIRKRGKEKERRKRKKKMKEEEKEKRFTQILFFLFLFITSKDVLINDFLLQLDRSDVLAVDIVHIGTSGAAEHHIPNTPLYEQQISTTRTEMH